MALKIGDEAPDFTLTAVVGVEKVRVILSDYRGKKNVVIAFYPLDWTPVCGAQLPSYNADLDRFAGFETQVLAISVDSIYSHMAWQKRDIGIMNFPLCSDFYPHAEVAKKYGVVREGDPVPGINERAIFVVDKEGKIAFAKVYRIDAQPPNEELFQALKEIKTKELAAK